MNKDFNFKPTLTGSNITLRPLKESDFDALYQAASNPITWEQHPDPQRYQQEKFKQNFFQGAVKSNSALVVIDNKTQSIIGSSRYYQWNPITKEIAIGYTFLNHNYWGGQTNAEMKQLMLNHAYQWANTIWLHIGKGNIRSRKAAEKIGAHFSHEEILPVNGKDHIYTFYKLPFTKQLNQNPHKE